MYNKMLYHSSAEARGDILEQTIVLERMIDQYLANYFCPTEIKRDELKELLLFTERITLDAKKEILIAIVKVRQPAFLINNPDFLPMLYDVIPHRNIFAHLDLVHPTKLNEEDKYKLVFKKYKNGKLNRREYGMKELVKIQLDLSKLMGWLLDLVISQKK